MAAQRGSEVLCKIGDTESPTNFTTIGGQRITRLAYGEETINVGSKDGLDRFRELIRGGERTVSFSVDGIFKDSAAEETLRANVFDDAQKDVLLEMQFIMPDFGDFTGFFVATGYELGGEDKGEADYSATFESAGTITFTAA